jgi:ketosteroid isomerase-like protein
MSHQNVDIVQGFYEALNGGNLAAVLEKIDPDFEWWSELSHSRDTGRLAPCPRAGMANR